MDTLSTKPILKSQRIDRKDKFRKTVSFRDNGDSESGSIADVHEVESWKQFNIEDKPEGTCLTCTIF